MDASVVLGFLDFHLIIRDKNVSLSAFVLAIPGKIHAGLNVYLSLFLITFTELMFI